MTPGPSTIEKLKIETYNFSKHSIEDREKIICGLKISEKLSHLHLSTIKKSGIDNVVPLITCGRVEFIYLADKFIGFDGFDRLDGWNAFSHLVKVASGISTLVLGETQITNQLKRAFFEARKNGLCDGRMIGILSEVLRISKIVRTKMQLHPVSFSSIVKKKAEEIIGDLSDKTLFVIGTGAVAHDVFRVAKNFSKIIIYSRSPQKASQIAKEIEKHLKVKTEYVSSIKEGVENSDVIVTATDHPGYLINNEHIDGIRKKIVLIDLSIPRNISPDIANDNIFLFNVDTMISKDKNLEKLEESEKYIKAEIEKLKIRLNENKEVQEIASLNEEFREIIYEHLKKYTDIDEDEIVKISKSLSKKLLSRFFAKFREKSLLSSN